MVPRFGLSYGAAFSSRFLRPLAIIVVELCVSLSSATFASYVLMVVSDKMIYLTIIVNGQGHGL